MSQVDYNAMTLKELRSHFLKTRDEESFQAYLARARAEGTILTLSDNDPDWKCKLDTYVQERSEHKEA